MFVIDKTPEKLNRVLADLYLRKLRTSGEDISDMALLSEFLFGDRARTREVEEILAWLASPDAPDDDAPTEEDNVRLDSDDIDSLLLSDGPTRPTPPSPPTRIARRSAGAGRSPAAPSSTTCCWSTTTPRPTWTTSSS